MRRAAALALASAILGAAASAHAAPQAGAAVTAGAAFVGDRDDAHRSTELSLGLRGDLLLLRERDTTFGVGPYVEALTTATFHDRQLGGGAEVLVPVHPYLPVVLSVGPYARHAAPTGWEPGVAGSLFWGSRGYNYHSPYSLAGGALFEARYGLGDSREVAFVASAVVDLEFFILPFVVGYEALRAH